MRTPVGQGRFLRRSSSGPTELLLLRGPFRRPLLLALDESTEEVLLSLLQFPLFSFLFFSFSPGRAAISAFAKCILFGRSFASLTASLSLSFFPPLRTLLLSPSHSCTSRYCSIPSFFEPDPLPFDLLSLIRPPFFSLYSECTLRTFGLFFSELRREFTDGRAASHRPFASSLVRPHLLAGRVRILQFPRHQYATTIVVSSTAFPPSGSSTVTFALCRCRSSPPTASLNTSFATFSPSSAASIASPAKRTHSSSRVLLPNERLSYRSFSPSEHKKRQIVGPEGERSGIGV